MTARLWHRKRRHKGRHTAGGGDTRSSWMETARARCLLLAAAALCQGFGVAGRTLVAQQAGRRRAACHARRCLLSALYCVADLRGAALGSHGVVLCPVDCGKAGHLSGHLPARACRRGCLWLARGRGRRGDRPRAAWQAAAACAAAPPGEIICGSKPPLFRVSETWISCWSHNLASHAGPALFLCQAPERRRAALPPLFHPGCSPEALYGWRKLGPATGRLVACPSTPGRGRGSSGACWRRTSAGWGAPGGCRSTQQQHQGACSHHGARPIRDTRQLAGREAAAVGALL